jgi:hypothetical protein
MERIRESGGVVLTKGDSLINTDIPNTMIELSYAKSYSGFGSKDNGFLRHDEEWGKEDWHICISQTTL